jgi:hypothetical protein
MNIFPFIQVSRAEEPELPWEIPTVLAENENMVKADTDSDRYSLWIDTVSAAVCLVDEQTGYMWWSNPLSPEEYSPSTVQVEEEMRSQLIVTYFDENKVSKTVNSLECFVNDSVEISYAENGFQVEYRFEGDDQQFSLTLIYQLQDDCLRVSLPAGGIQEWGTSYISEVALLPFMLTGKRTQEGYVLLPDGSGALMRFDDPKPYAAIYQQKVYGWDIAVSRLYKKRNEENAYLPVLGMIRDSRGLLAVIEQNDAAAILTAFPTGKYADCANAYVKFTLRQMDTAVIANKDWKYKEYPVAEKQRSAYDCVVAIYPLPEAKDYNDLALAYRDLLNKQYNRKKLTGYFTGSIEIYGCGWKKATFLGFPIKKSVVATTLSEARDISDKFINAGLSNFAVVLKAFGSEGYELRTNYKISPSRKLGGKADLNQLSHSLDGAASLYWVKDVVSQFNKSIFNRSKVIKGLNNVPIELGHYLPSTFALKEGGQRWWINRPDEMVKAIKRIDKQIEPGYGIGFENVGDMLYSDYYENNFMERQTSLKLIFDALNQFNNPVMLNGGNLYAALNATLVADLPAGSSNFDCMSESVPFYSIVFFGYKQLSSRPFNVQTDWSEALLDCLEYGLAPSIQLTSSGNRELRETSLSRLINTCFDDVGEGFISLLKKYQQTVQQLSGSHIIRHKRENGLVTISYSNGAEVIINRSGKEVKIKDKVLKSGEWYIE